MDINIRNSRILQSLELGCFVAFFIYFIQYSFEYIPLKDVLGGRELLNYFIVDLFQIEWTDYISSPNLKLLLSILTNVFSVFFLSCGLISFYLKKNTKHPVSKLFQRILILGSLGMCVCLIMNIRYKQFEEEYIFMSIIQLMLPALLIYAVRNRDLSVSVGILKSLLR
ncbi:hypothetical protein [Sediminitomix flava]|uniref:Uncharacterized protein n=1 Tax=Sediminitomix flava TaxID=379075 RepID=A0A315Z079_SEDFL|nr:hypothetical protein [Sediminitomix flava]PWJ36038.1 hypothetical protein BC781_10953 [Sediminitomix flava]